MPPTLFAIDALYFVQHILSAGWHESAGNPDAALILCSEDFERGFPKRRPKPLRKTRCMPDNAGQALLASPLSGNSVQSLRCSARHNGTKTYPNVGWVSDSVTQHFEAEIVELWLVFFVGWVE
jgi:hypothetical protein